MGRSVYILAFCDGDKSWSTMRLIGATTDETMLYAMIAAKIKSGEMSYGDAETSSWDAFSDDFKNGSVNLDKLQRGFVYDYDDLQITDPVSLDQFPEAAVAYEEITEIQSKVEIEKLELDRRSLIYTEVELRTDFGYTSFFMPGFCDRDNLEASDGFQEFMEGTTDAEVNACVYSYSVGAGESEYPSEDELAIIKQYADELHKEHSVDSVLSDFISFYYEAEQEY